MPDTIHLCQAFFSQINPNLATYKLEFKIPKPYVCIV